MQALSLRSILRSTRYRLYLPTGLTITIGCVFAAAFALQPLGSVKPRSNHTFLVSASLPFRPLPYERRFRVCSGCPPAVKLCSRHSGTTLQFSFFKFQFSVLLSIITNKMRTHYLLSRVERRWSSQKQWTNVGKVSRERCGNLCCLFHTARLDRGNSRRLGGPIQGSNQSLSLRT